MAAGGARNRLVHRYRTPGPGSFHITLFGGGEPMLCWESIVRPAIELVEELCAQRLPGADTHHPDNQRVYILPPTSPTSASAHASTSPSPSSSSPSFQNAQRRNYDRVLANLRALLAAGVVPAINSVITDLAVNRMPDMVRAAAATSPACAISPSSLPPSRILRVLPRLHRRLPRSPRPGRSQRHDAQHLGAAQLRCHRRALLRRRARPRSAGDLTLCPCISAPDQSGYDRRTYGRVTDDGVEIDTERLARLLALDVDSQPWCRDCFARYNCGGGCLNNTAERGNKTRRRLLRLFP